MKEIQEDEVLFERTDVDLVTVETSSIVLLQATSHNVIVLNEKLSQAESNNNKLKDEIISLKEEMNKKRKVECDMAPLKRSILEEQVQLHDVEMECFTMIQKMADKMKMVKKTSRNCILDQLENEIPASQG